MPLTESISNYVLNPISNLKSDSEYTDLKKTMNLDTDTDTTPQKTRSPSRASVFAAEASEKMTNLNKIMYVVLGCCLFMCGAMFGLGYAAIEYSKESHVVPTSGGGSDETQDRYNMQSADGKHLVRTGVALESYEMKPELLLSKLDEIEEINYKNIRAKVLAVQLHPSGASLYTSVGRLDVDEEPKVGGDVFTFTPVPGFAATKQKAADDFMRTLELASAATDSGSDNSDNSAVAPGRKLLGLTKEQVKLVCRNNYAIGGTAWRLCISSGARWQMKC